MPKYRGTGEVSSNDYKAVKWVGKTKGGKAVTIEFEKAINLGNIDWQFAEKDDTVSEIVMTAVYKNTDQTATDTIEPWTIEIEGEEAGAKSILLGVGLFYIGEQQIALTRGGGKFSVEREFREINADGDRGPVEDRIVMESSRATLTMNVLTIIESFADAYTAIEQVEQ
jgi:hypothetical protein